MAGHDRGDGGHPLRNLQTAPAMLESRQETGLINIELFK